MYFHVLTCVDGSYDSEVAAKYAMGIAIQSNAQFSILNVNDGATSIPRESLGRLERIAKRRGLKYDIITATGDRLDQIRSVAQNIGADVVVASSGGKVKQRGLFSRNIAYEMIKTMPQTVFIIKSVKATTARVHHKLLYPVDVITPSLEERVYALRLIAKFYGLSVSLLRCTKIQPDRFLTEHEEIKFKKNMRAYMAPLKGGLEEDGIPVRLYTKICYSIKGEVIDFLKRNRHDLLFLQITPGGLSSFIHKDFAIEVMKSSECNVILWKPKKA